jgi:dinuclear metal center YbgI/SA1388 family protein
VTELLLAELSTYLDAHLRISDVPDYPTALNGVQVANRGPLRHVAVAVDASLRTIDGAIAAGANLLLVHHGIFWGGLQRIDGRFYERIRRLMEHDVAVYAAHLPLDTHETHGNSRLLAAELGLHAAAGFASYEGVYCGVRGEDSIDTAALHARLRAFSQQHGGDAIATPFDSGRVTRRWAVCSGSGATRDALEEASVHGIDTLIVGEGPHWTAVEADELGIVVLYGGHYATETLGVRSLASHLERRYGLTWTFVAAPTGL